MWSQIRTWDINVHIDAHTTYHSTSTHTHTHTHTHNKNDTRITQIKKQELNTDISCSQTKAAYQLRAIVRQYCVLFKVFLNSTRQRTNQPASVQRPGNDELSEQCWRSFGCRVVFFLLWISRNKIGIFQLLMFQKWNRRSQNEIAEEYFFLVVTNINAFSTWNEENQQRTQNHTGNNIFRLYRCWFFVPIKILQNGESK